MGIRRIGNGIRVAVRATEQKVAWNHFQKVRRLFNLIVLRTPVYTGTLRRNWVASYDRIHTTLHIVNENPAVPLPPAEFNLEYVRGQFRTIVISNKTPYVNRIEFGGWSNQAPFGMVRISMREVFSV